MSLMDSIAVAVFADFSFEFNIIRSKSKEQSDDETRRACRNHNDNWDDIDEDEVGGDDGNEPRPTRPTEGLGQVMIMIVWS